MTIFLTIYLIIAAIWFITDTRVLIRAAYLDDKMWVAAVLSVWILASLFWPLDLIYRIYRKVSRT